jgi:1-deoxy-D-xylulose-5-phosphate reductoisomerase
MPSNFQPRHIALLGSTGSIGCQTLEIVRAFPEQFIVEILTANNNVELLIQQSLEFQPNTVVIANTEKYQILKDALSHTDIKVFAGEDSVADIASNENIDIVLIALVGFSGLRSAIKSIQSSTHIALANKEILVVAGDYIMREAQKNNVAILPVDSEHSAIFQSLIGETHSSIEKIILTASGGPFRGFNKEQLKHVSLNDALKHPNWTMGKKITIDSASMMNKGLEVIEAKHLFHISQKQIEVIIHPQSIIHSLIQYKDSSVKAQLGLPDMKLPILYALSFPERLESKLPRLDFGKCPDLQFFKPDLELFPCLQLAYNATERGGNMPCILNAANEIAVQAFLSENIRFTDIPDIIEKTMYQSNFFISQPNIDDLFDTDKNTRIFAQNLITQKTELTCYGNIH